MSKSISFGRRHIENLYWDFRGTRTLSLDGTAATFDSTGRSSHSLNFFQLNEATLVEDMINEASPDDVLWDVGASIGFHSAFVGQHVDHTVAFEPVPTTVEELVDNLQRNNVEATVRPHALGDTEGELSLTNDVSPRIEEGERLTCPVHTGDSLIRSAGIAAPTMLKIDVEGAEGNVLEGMSDALESCRVIYVEVHRPGGDSLSVADFGYSVDDIFEILWDSGFCLERLTDRGTELHLKAS